MHARVLRRLLLVLLAVSAAGLLWARFWPARTLVIDAGTALEVAAADDRIQGGHSVATLVRDAHQLGLDCSVAEATARPACELRVSLKPGPLGLDLRAFDTLRVWITARGPGSGAAPRVSLLLREFDPACSRAGELETERVDAFFFAPGQHAPGRAIALTRFGDADWWARAHPDAPDRSTAARSRVTSLALATGPGTGPGRYQIRLERIEFQAPALPAATVWLALVVLWMVAVAGALAADRFLLRHQLRLSTVSQASLRRLNDGLLLETRSLAEMASTDPLTGVLNRRGLAGALLELVRQGGDAVFPLTLVFIDIDHFRRINEEHGHAVGDQVIQGLAELVRSAVQRDDLFARWGGEEFLLVIRNTPGLEGRTIAERLRERIADAQWPVSLRITCSFGITAWHPGEDLHEGVRRADEAMYRAKQNGRDRVEVETGPAAPGNGPAA